MASPDQIKNILDNIVLVSESVSSDNDRYSKQVFGLLQRTLKSLRKIEVQKVNTVGRELRRRPRSSYIIFCMDRRPELKKMFPDMNGKDTIRMLSMEWQTMTNEEKEPYTQQSKAESVRYAAPVEVSPMEVSPMEVSQVEVSPVEVEEKKVPAILHRCPSRDDLARVPFTYDTMVNVNQTRARLGRHPIEPASNVRKTALSYEAMLLNVNQARYNAGVAPIRDAVLSTQRNMHPLSRKPSTGSRRRAKDDGVMSNEE
jgi:hypothetical protein